MNELHDFLSARKAPSAAWCNAQRLISLRHRGLGKWFESRHWTGAFKHMRRVAPGFRFLRESDGSWLMEHGRGGVTKTKRLHDLTGPIGRPVMIVASGPSARDADWDAVRESGDFIVAVNGAPTLLKRHGIRPDLHVVVDRDFAAHGREHFENSADVPLIATFRVASILAHAQPGVFKTKALAIVERVNSWYGLPRLAAGKLAEMNERSGRPFHLPETPDSKFSVGWSDAPELGIFSGCTVVAAALQISLGLGAKEIRIAGMDLNSGGRAYDEAANARASLLEEQYEEYILPTFRMMNRALQGKGVRIRNLSPVCRMPAEIFDFGEA